MRPSLTEDGGFPVHFFLTRPRLMTSFRSGFFSLSACPLCIDGQLSNLTGALIHVFWRCPLVFLTFLSRKHLLLVTSRVKSDSRRPFGWTTTEPPQSPSDFKSTSHPGGLAAGECPLALCGFLSLRENLLPLSTTSASFFFPSSFFSPTRASELVTPILPTTS